MGKMLFDGKFFPLFLWHAVALLRTPGPPSTSWEFLSHWLSVSSVSALEEPWKARQARGEREITKPQKGFLEGGSGHSPMLPGSEGEKG